MNRLVIGFYLLLSTDNFAFIRCNVTATNPKSQIWFADTDLKPTQPSPVYNRREIHAEESEETVQVIPHDPFSGGEEISAETMEKQRRNHEKSAEHNQWQVSYKSPNASRATLTLRNYPHKVKFNKSKSLAGSGSAPVTVTAVVASQTPSAVIMLDPPLAQTPLKQPQVSRTVRYRTWSSNYSTSNVAPKNQSSLDLLHSPSNKKVDQEVALEVQPSHISTKRKRPVLYYIPKKALRHNDYSSESDESSSDEAFDDMPINYKQFVQNQFTLPPAPRAPPAAHKEQSVQTTTPLTIQSFSTHSLVNTQLTTSTQIPFRVDITPRVTSAPAAAVTLAEASYKKQTYLDHPIAYLMAHLPTSTLPALPTYPSDSSLSANIARTEKSKATQIPFTTSIPVVTEAASPLPLVESRPAESSVESVEGESSEEDYDDSRAVKVRPAVEYDNDDDEYSDEEYDEPEPAPAPKYKKAKTQKTQYRKRPVKVETIDYPDYDIVETADKRRPVTILLERVKPKSRSHKKYSDSKPVYYVKGGRYQNRPLQYHKRHHGKHPLQLVQTADGQQYYIANGNWVRPSANPNVIIAYKQPTINFSSTGRTPKVLLTTDAQYANQPRKMKWISQLDQSKDISKPTIVYQQVVPVGNQMQPYQLYTDPRVIQHPVLVGNASNKYQGTKQLLVPSVEKHKGSYVANPKLTRFNHLEDDGYYALMDSKGRLTPAHLVLTKPKSEKVYKVIKTRQPTNTDVYRCDWSNCQLPNCFCGTNAFIPGNLKVSEVPQIILLTFDDSVNGVNYDFYNNLLKNRKNPNNCPITTTFFVSHDWTDYSAIQNLYFQGHEMASHSISHGDGGRFSRKKWEEEILGQKEILKTLGGVQGDDIRGMRAPFLQPGGDNQFMMLQLANLTYDSSLPVRRTYPPIWPYTLDYGIPHECNIPPCPRGHYPGLWEVPLVMWTDLKGGRCSMADACATPSKSDEIYRMLMSNFEHHYYSNRSPFPMYYHYAWFTKSHNLEAFTTFLDTVLQLGDVYFVTVSQMIEWMKQPTSLANIQQFAPWKCENQSRTACVNPQTCSYTLANGKEQTAQTCQSCVSGLKAGN